MSEVRQVAFSNHHDRLAQNQEIVDFNVALDNYRADDYRTFGIKSYPRVCDPSMKEIISWRDCPQDIWNYKASKEALSRSTEFARQNKKICREENAFVSEAHDSYRKFIISQQKGVPIFVDAPHQDLKNVSTEFKSNYMTKKVGQPQVIREEPVKQVNFLEQPEESRRLQTQYEKDFSYKGIKSYRELQNQLIQNAKQLNYENGPRNLKSDTYTRPLTAAESQTNVYCVQNYQGASSHGTPACNYHPPSCNNQPASCNKQPASCNNQPPACGVQGHANSHFQSRYLSSADHRALQYSQYQGPKVNTHDVHQSTVRCSSPEENCKKAGFYRSRQAGAEYRYLAPYYSQDDMLHNRGCSQYSRKYDLSKSVDHGRFGEGIDGSHLYYVEPKQFHEKIILDKGESYSKNNLHDKDQRNYDTVFIGKKPEYDDESRKMPGEEPFSNVKSRLFNTKNYKPYKQQVENFEDLDEETKRRRIERVKKFRDTTRWLPNSAMRTYFGKPPFECYGNANTRPQSGGYLYGEYLLTHNVNPHKEANDPKNLQSYENAIYTSYRQPPRKNEPPRKKLETNALSKDEIDILRSRSQIMPKPNIYETTKISKPQLVTSMRFASPENSPRASIEKEKKILNTQDRALAKSQKKKITRESVNTQFPSNVPLKSGYIHQSGREVLVNKEEIERAWQKDQLQISKKQNAKSKVKKNAPASTSLGHRLDDQANLQPSVIISGPTPGMGLAIDNNRGPMVNFETSLGTQALKQLDSNLATGQHLVAPQKYEPAKYQSQGQQARAVSVNQRLFGTEENDEGHDPEYLRKIIDEKAQKKSKKNRIALKVTEVYPVRSGRANDIVQAANNSLHVPQPEFSSTINPYQPTRNFLSSLSEQERNPQNYKQVPPAFLDRIPYAGKFQTKSHDIKEIF